MTPGLDSRGHPNFKQCPGCPALLGRTKTSCPDCGHVFIRHERKGGKPGRPARVDLEAPEPDDGAIDKMLAHVAPAKPAVNVGQDGRFYCRVTSSGGLVICWPGFDVRFTLTAGERATLLKVLTA